VFGDSQSVIPLYLYGRSSRHTPRRDLTDPHEYVMITTHVISNLACANLVVRTRIIQAIGPDRSAVPRCQI
jgi:hypothetical protein